MPRIVVFFTACLLHLQPAAQTLQLGPEKIKSLDSLYRAMFPANDPGAIILVSRNGSPLFRKAYGMASLEFNIPLNTDHKMGIGSISKQFAAVSILLLQQEGKLSYQDDIKKYLPVYNTYGRTITIAHILSHTSGIPSYTELDNFDSIVNMKLSNHQLVKFFEAKPLLFEPGTNFSYSNSGYVLAALIVEKVSGMPYNEFLQKRIFQPLMMTESGIGSSDFIAAGKTGEYSGPTPKGRVKMETQYDWYWAYGAGQIISTVDDMLKWDEGLYQPSFIKPELLKLAHTSFILKDGKQANYGLGWAQGRLQNKTIIQHGGAIGGYRSMGVRIPEDHLYIIILSNAATTNSGLAANRTLTILYDLPALKENKQDVQSWKEIEGIYESLNAGLRLQTNFGTLPAYYTIRVDSANRVTAQRSSSPPVTLSPAGKDLLFDKMNPYTGWKIERNTQGAVEGIRFNQYFPGTGPERFNKRVSAKLPPEPVVAKADSAALVKFTGMYAHKFGDRTRIVADKGQLFMEDPVLGTRTTLNWIKGNTFWIKETDREIIFDADKKGSITGLRYFSGFQQIVMQRVEELY